MNTVWPNKEEEAATPRLGSIDVGDFSNTIYDFFTGDQTGENFLTNIGLQVSLLFFLQKVIIFLQNSNILRNWNNCSLHTMWWATSAATWFGRLCTINKLTFTCFSVFVQKSILSPVISFSSSPKDSDYFLFDDWSSLPQGLRGSDKVSCQIKWLFFFKSISKQ